MFDSKILFTVIGLLLAMFAVSKFNKTSIKENFAGGPSMTWKVMREGNQKGQMFSVPGQWQSMLAPRMSSESISAHVNYNMPATEHQALSCDPLSLGDMVKENYSRENYGCRSCGGGCGTVRCMKGGETPHGVNRIAPLADAGHAAGNYNEVTQSVYDSSTYPDYQSMLPTGDMTVINAEGEPSQVVTYDRLIYANRNSRLRKNGDMIRGDLPIVPCGADWFRPAVNPNIDLQPGALAVMGGMQNETAQSLYQMINHSSGGADTTLGGVSLTNMSNQFSSSLGASLADVNVTAFP